MANAPSSIWWDVAMYVAAFVCGAVLVKRAQELVARRTGAGRSGGRPAPSTAVVLPRPANQLPVLGFDELVQELGAEQLLKNIERKTRLSQGNWQRDCQPVVEAFAEFVQRLPASESHHHAQPGGLLQHGLEVADAALTFRAGMEIPQGAGTEERKRDEHRWTVAILIGALLHDVGKPVTDTKVTLFQADPRLGQPWRPLAGSMRSFSAQAYSVAFADPTERDYKAHAKLGAMLLQSMVPQRTRRWLSEQGGVLDQLLAYLAGDAPDGVIGEIVKRADSDSVSRNLAHGPRTRFASARTRPLIERLMEALRRMLAEGAQLPLNRPGAAGWVHDGSVWFVCARLADAVRDYLGENESAQGIPGKDKNDRLFDTWQESGAVRPAPDGGAVWRVRVRCEAWSSPDVLTVLCFPLDKLYSDPAKYPTAMRGEVVPAAAAAAAPPAGAVSAQSNSTPTLRPLVPSSSAAVPAAKPALTATPAVETSSTPRRPLPTERIEPTFDAEPKKGQGSSARDIAPLVDCPADVGQSIGISPSSTLLLSGLEPEAMDPPTAPADSTPTSAVEVLNLESLPAQPRPAVPTVLEPVQAPDAVPEAGPAATAGAFADYVLSPDEAADLTEGRARVTVAPTLTLTAPLRPRERNGGHPQPPRMPSPASQAFLAWLAQSVGSGELRYNEDGALVHFVPEGALLLSPEIFRRFMDAMRAVTDGPVGELRAAHGDAAYKRLQNELAKSGFTQRNGDENLHYFQFVKADGQMSRTASFYLLRQPELLWNPVPQNNDRIRRAGRPPGASSVGKASGKALKLPATGKAKGEQR